MFRAEGFGIREFGLQGLLGLRFCGSRIQDLGFAVRGLESARKGPRFLLRFGMGLQVEGLGFRLGPEHCSSGFP